MRNLGKNLAKVVKAFRLAHNRGYSQNDLGALLNLKGQAISNLERGLCSLNVKHILKVSVILDIPLDRLRRAMVQDYEDALNAEIWKLMDADRTSGGLRKACGSGPSLQDQKIYADSVPRGRDEAVSSRSSFS